MIPHESQTQIERDLLRNASDRLVLWVRDTAMRAQAIDLDESQAFSMAVSAMMSEVLRLLKGVGMKREDFLVLAQQSWDSTSQFQSFERKRR